MYWLLKKLFAYYMAYGCCILFICLPIATGAQVLKVRKATAQNTYGGLAGSHSCRYTFELYGKDVPSISPDTLWIGDNAHALGNNAKSMWQKGIKGRTATITLFATVPFRNEHLTTSFIENATKMPHLPEVPHYKGVACFVYHWHGLRYQISIPQITEQLPSISYP